MADGARLIPDDLSYRGPAGSYVPGSLSPLATTRLVKAACALVARVEGLTVQPPIAPEVQARLLREANLELKRELVRIGALLPGGTS